MNILKKLFSTSPVANLKQLSEEGAVIIDVRTVSEFNSGHLKKSINIPLNTLSGQLNKIKKSNKPVIAVCRSGSRSSMAVTF